MALLHPGHQQCFRYVPTSVQILVNRKIAGFAIGALFVREVFNPESKEQAEAMIYNVRNAFKKNFKNLQWMDDQTRKVAEEKADAISDMIGKYNSTIHQSCSK